MDTPEIIKPTELEIIPATQLPTLREDLASMRKFSSDLDPVLEEARKLCLLPSWDKTIRIRAGELTKQYKDILKTAEDTIEPHKRVVNDFKKEYITGPENAVSDKVDELKKILSPRMGEFDRAEQKAAEEEKQRVARELRQKEEREAELKRQADEEQAKHLRQKRVSEIRADLKAGKFGNPKTVKAKREAEKLLREAGAVEEAALTKAASDEQEAKERAAQAPARVRVAPVETKVAGNVRRINYSAECTDVLAFLRAYLSLTKDEVRRRYLEDVLLRALKWTADKDNIAINKALSEAARDTIKTGPDDKKHELTPEQFEKRYPFVQVKEERSF